MRRGHPRSRPRAQRASILAGRGHLPGHRRRRLPRARICATSCCAAGTASSAWTTSRPGSLANIEHIRDPERFVHVNVDIIEPYHVEEPVDFVYHLASPASPIDYLRLPLHTLKVGSYGTHHTLGLAKAKRARFLLASTSEVYGDPHEHPAVRELLGARQPDRPARRLRRGQALRGGADDGLPPPAGRRHGDRADLQHLRRRGCARTTGARSRRSCARRSRTGRSRCSATAARRARSATSSDLIRGIIALGRVRLSRPGEHRQPRRVHAARAGRDGQRADRRRARRSSSRRCRSTIPSSAGPTSRWRGSCSAGRRRCRCARACKRTIEQSGVELLVGGPR